jgi:hypothetical protein
MIIWVIIQHLEALLQSPGSQLMPLCNGFRIFFILFFECCQLFTVSSVNSTAWESRMSWISASSKSWIHQSQVLLTQGCTLFILSCSLGNLNYSLTASYQTFSSSCVELWTWACPGTTLLLLCSQLLWLPAFTDTNKFPHLHPRYCERCGKCSSSWMFLRLPGWEAVRLRYWCWKDTQLGYGIHRLFGFPEDFFKNMTLNARFLDFRYIFVTNIYWAWPFLAATLTATGHTHTHTHTRPLPPVWGGCDDNLNKKFLHLLDHWP